MATAKTPFPILRRHRKLLDDAKRMLRTENTPARSQDGQGPIRAQTAAKPSGMTPSTLQPRDGQ